MEFKWDDPSVMASHFLLQDLDTAMKVRDTVSDKGLERGEKLVARMTINGVEIDFAIVEKYFKEIYAQTEARARKQFEDIDAEVERRVAERISGKANSLIEALDDLRVCLENVSTEIRPYWER